MDAKTLTGATDSTGRVEWSFRFISGCSTNFHERIAKVMVTIVPIRDLRRFREAKSGMAIQPPRPAGRNDRAWGLGSANARSSTFRGLARRAERHPGNRRRTRPRLDRSRLRHQGANTHNARSHNAQTHHHFDDYLDHSSDHHDRQTASVPEPDDAETYPAHR